MHSRKKSKFQNILIWLKSHSPLTHADKLTWISELLTDSICGYYTEIQPGPAA